MMLFSAVAPAQSAADADTPLRRAEAALFAVREEQQAVFQQFQMVQALQQFEMQKRRVIFRICSPGSDPQL